MTERHLIMPHFFPHLIMLCVALPLQSPPLSSSNVLRRRRRQNPRFSVVLKGKRDDDETNKVVVGTKETMGLRKDKIRCLESLSPLGGSFDDDAKMSNAICVLSKASKTPPPAAVSSSFGASNVPTAIAIGLGFASVSAVLYPASKATEKAMRATELAMEETTKLMERDALRAFNEGEQASLEWQELGKELRLVLKNIEQWGKPLMGDENSLESFDLNQLGESVKDSLAEVLEKSLIGIRDMNNSYNRIEDRPQLGGMELMQQSIDDNLFKWQDAITDVIEDLTNLTLEAASKGQTANEETLKRALNQAKVASESFLMSSSSRTTDDRGNSSSTDEGEMEVDPATNSDRKKISSAASYEKQDDDFDIRTRAASEKLKEESRAKKESMDSL